MTMFVLFTLSTRSMSSPSFGIMLRARRQRRPCASRSQSSLEEIRAHPGLQSSRKILHLLRRARVCRVPSLRPVPAASEFRAQPRETVLRLRDEAIVTRPQAGPGAAMSALIPNEARWLSRADQAEILPGAH